MADIRSNGIFIVGTGEDDFIQGYSPPGFPGDEGDAQILTGFSSDDWALYGLNLGSTSIDGYVETDEAQGDGADGMLGGMGSDTLIGGGGDDTLIGGAASFFGNNDVLIGGWGNDLLIGGNGAQSSDGGNDQLFGGPGDDVLNGMEGTDRLDGGDETDVAIFAGPLEDYTIERQEDGSYRIFDDSTTNAILIGIEFAFFESTAISVADAAERIARWQADPTSEPNVVPLASLFTSAADVVDFTNLDPEQVPLVETADIYAAIGGDDTVRLPDAEQIPGTTATFSTRADHRFDAGAGADTVSGGLLDDFVEGGADDDVIEGSPGGDDLRGGDGYDRIDYVSGDYAGFSGFDDGQRQTLDGGDNRDDPKKLDTLLLPEGEYRYTVTGPRGAWSQTTTLVEKIENGQVRVAFETRLIEFADVEDAIVNTASLPLFAVSMARFADRAYSDSVSTAGGWRAVSAMELGIKPSEIGDDLVYDFIDGAYAAFSLTKPGGAVAHVVSGLVDGVKTLLVAFRGTDDLIDDSPDFFPFAGHYAKFKPLIDGLMDYIDAQNIAQVLITGHSLGAAMAQHFVREENLPNAQIFTLGSPGDDRGGRSADQVNFVHAYDPVTYASYFPIYERKGTDVVVDRADLSVGLVQHATTNYRDTISLLVELARGDGPFADSDLGKALLSARNYAGPDLRISLGSSGKDSIEASSRDSFALGAGGADRIAVHDAVRKNVSRIVDGGSGNDLVVLDGDRSDYEAVRRDGDALVRSGEPDGVVAELHSIEWIIYADGVYELGDDGRYDRVRRPERPDANASVFKLDGEAAYADAGDGDIKVIGTRGADVILAGSGDKTINAGRGADVVSVSGSALGQIAGLEASAAGRAVRQDKVTINGGKGADLMRGGESDTTYVVDDASDRVVETKDGGDDTIRATVSFRLPNSVEKLRLRGDEAIDGEGNSAANDIVGNRAKNVLTGLGGNDILDGGAGGDRIIGGRGADEMLAGADDQARDVFVFESASDSSRKSTRADVISEFLSGGRRGDRIDLSAIDADEQTEGDQAFRFVSQFAPADDDESAGQIRVSVGSEEARVLIDADGDGDVDMMIRVVGVESVSESSFIL